MTRSPAPEPLHRPRLLQVGRTPAPRKGAMLVLIAFCLPLVIIMAAFAVDVAWMQLVRTELRTATDSAARAGSFTLSQTQDRQTSRAAAKEAASRNNVASQPLLLADQDIELGQGQQANEASRFQFIPGGSRPNAVRVEGRRTAGSPGGTVSLLLSGFMGIHEFSPRHSATSAQLDRDICLVVDRSGSMASGLFSNRIPGRSGCDPPHPSLSRWGALATAVDAFLDELEATSQHELVGLASYASDARACGITYRIAQTDADLSPDTQPVRDAMGQIGARPINGRTSISAGVDEGVRVLTSSEARPFAVKTLVLMTDGLHNTGREPVLSAREAAALDIVIHTVTFSDDADLRRMRDVAQATGGRHYHAPSAAELERIFREIAATLPVLLVE